MSWFRGSSDEPQQPAARVSPYQTRNVPPAPGSYAPLPSRPSNPSSGRVPPPSDPSRYGSSSNNKLDAGPATDKIRPSTPQYQQQPQGNPGIFQVVPCPDDALALTNRIIFNPADFPHGSYIQIKRDYIYTVHNDNRVQRGCMGVANHQRKWMSMAQSDQEEVLPFDPRLGIGPDHLLGQLTVDVGYLLEAKARPDVVFDAEQMEAAFKQTFDGCMFTIGQPLIFGFDRKHLLANVRKLDLVELMSFEKPGSKSNAPAREGRMGVLVGPQTEILFSKADGSVIKIKASAKKGPANSIIQPNFKFEDMGIGGLDAEFSNIFRRAFASRIFPPGLVDKLGIQHVKGILLYGPPGTGKTLMARQIGKMLNAREPKIVNGPEILNKFVGQSEENIRKLFGDAEKEYKAKGDESGLHIIIFDELDAICKQRGSQNSGTGVGDSVVNQLLSKMDGVDQLNNILIIGMTNRKDMIDEALLRSGRLECHIEISLPDEAGRLQILKIHTTKMNTNGIMAPDVDVAELASLTKNFSGAEIGGLVKSATSFAFNRHVKVGTQAGISDDIDDLQVSRQDFMMALDEVHPAFGVSEEELAQVVQNGIIHYNRRIEEILKDGTLYIEQVRNSERTPCVAVCVHGPPGAGKTALAATIAMSSDFPFIKLISPEAMVGFDEGQKIHFLNKVFTDSYKSRMSVVVVDNIERIVDWSPIGPRFSNRVLQALMTLLTKAPPKGRRLLVLATTSNSRVLSDMELMDSFQAEIHVQAISQLSSLLRVVREVNLFSSDRDFARLQDLLQQAGLGEEDKFVIGVKRLLNLIEMSRQDDQPADRLFNGLMNHIGQSGLTQV